MNLNWKNAKLVAMDLHLKTVNVAVMDVYEKINDERIGVKNLDHILSRGEVLEQV